MTRAFVARSLKARLARLENASRPHLWAFTLDNGRTVEVPVEVVLQVFTDGLRLVHEPDPDAPPPSPDLLLLARVTATSERSLLGASVVRIAVQAREAAT